jgi:hypothetical protein
LLVVRAVRRVDRLKKRDEDLEEGATSDSGEMREVQPFNQKPSIRGEAGGKLEVGAFLRLRMQDLVKAEQGLVLGAESTGRESRRELGNLHLVSLHRNLFSALGLRRVVSIARDAVPCSQLPRVTERKVPKAKMLGG